jgi:hypothetical protein
MQKWENHRCVTVSMGSVHKKKGKTFILKIWSWVIITGKWNPLKVVWCGTCRLVQWAVPRGCPYRPEVCRIHRGFSSWVCTTVTEIVVRENKYSQSERSGVNCPHRTNGTGDREPSKKRSVSRWDCENRRSTNSLWRLPDVLAIAGIKFVYYESIKWDLNRRLIYECRCYERLKVKAEGSTRLTYTGLCEGLEHLKIETRLIDERFPSVISECEIVTLKVRRVYLK